MHGVRGGRPARSGPDWRQASKLLPGLTPEPKEVTVVVAAGRDKSLSAGATNTDRELGRTLGLFLDKQASIQVSYADELESLQGEIQAAIDERQAKTAVKQ